MFGERERPLMPAQFALRVAILSGFALVMFSIIFFRLWYLQVLSGDKYLKQAKNNQVREVTVRAPRGEILDRQGHVLVDNRTALALQLNPTELPRTHRRRQREFARLGNVIGMSQHEISKQLREQTKDLPANPVTLKRDVPYDLVYYLRENQDSYPGVTVQHVYVRNYPDGNLAAQIFGYVREITGPQLKEPRYQGLTPGDQVGQSGVENTYDNVLRGTNGMTRVQVDAQGRPTGGVLSQTQPKPGDNLLLSIDTPVQQAGEAALNSFSTPGAFVAMNVNDGEVLAMGSAPAFDPSIFTRPITQRQYRALTSRATDAPLANRAIQGLYPTGSTFKMITATAALEHKLIAPQTIFNDTGTLKLDTLVLKNAGDVINGPINMSDALKVSSDIYFYTLGLKAKASKGHGQIQDWARNYGLGEKTGIDLPAEVDGLIPTPAWRNQLYREGLTDRPWTAGDNVNLAVGQGDLYADPLQMAVAYAALGNGGTVVNPHIGDDVETVTGKVLEEIKPAARRHVDISPTTRDTIMDGLTRAAMEPGGTSYPIFGNFRLPVAGKTGTAERPNQADQSWYVALAPANDPQIVVAVTLERGGFGADTAAPIAARILEHYFNLPITPASAGTAKTQE
jgi:penicillin-binding protein 2